MSIVSLIVVLIGVIALAVRYSGGREDRERQDRRRELREAPYKAIRKREARAARGPN